MQLNMTTDYATRILIYLAIKKHSASSQEIAEAMKIPPKYIGTVAKKLRDRGYIKATQGASGGYTLERSPDDITLRDVLLLMEDGVKINRCHACEPHCLLFDGTQCPLNNTYNTIQELIEAAFCHISIGDLAVKSNERGMINDR